MMRARGGRNVPALVDRSAAIEMLPDVYADVLRLRDAGHGPPEIARRLRIAPEAVATALEIAEAKLARLLAQDDSRDEPAKAP
jgi:DNA-directed RNA polymerase specialized sigma24 family protein